MESSEVNLNKWNHIDHGFFVMVNKILLRKYRRKSPSGKYMSSPYESIIFGIIHSFTVNNTKEDSKNYGYMYMSIDRLSWEIGTSYSTTEECIKNLLNDGLIVKVDKKDRKETYDTEAYMAVMSKLEILAKEYEDITYENDENYKKRETKNDRYARLLEENNRLKQQISGFD